MNLMVRTCNYDAMNAQRIFARGFVVAGGVFWVAASFGAMNSYLGKTFAQSALTALIPLALAVVVFLVGWFYERLASVVLAVGAVGVILWGVLGGWEMGVWLTMGVFLIAPIAISALLYLLAAQTQTVCELSPAKPA
jgi:hypothetical protein